MKRFDLLRALSVRTSTHAVRLVLLLLTLILFVLGAGAPGDFGPIGG